MPCITAADVEAGARALLVHGSRGAAFSGVSIDTRTLRDRELFFAIRGAKNDGHQYVMNALERGALGAVVETSYEFPGEFPNGRVLLRVRNTHQALKDLAADVRNRWPGSVVAVTGSMGKTTTKEFAAHVLQTEYRVYRSPGNFNNLFGLPLALLGLDNDDLIGIFELGMSAPGEIAEMCRIAAPTIGVITNVAPVHLAFFESLEGIARAKAELAESLSPGGLLIFNGDDPLVRGIAAGFAGEKVAFGFSEDADIRADQIEIVALDETRFRLWCSGDVMKGVIPLAGPHYVMNTLPAIALGSRFGLRPGRMLESLRHLPAGSMRGQVLRFAEGFTVIDDCYNSNPRALKQMIEVLVKVPSFTRRVLIAGEMLELGSESPSLHFECGTWAAGCGVNLVAAVQGDAREICRAATLAGMSDTEVHFFSDVQGAADFAEHEMREGDLALIKGSRGVRMEKIVQVLRSRFKEVPVGGIVN